MRASWLPPNLQLSHLPSFVCRSRHFESRWYRRWAQRFAAGDPDITKFGPGFAEVFRMVWQAMAFDGAQPRFRHRKMWEWCAIAEVLHRRGMLAPGRRGVGFAVGHEPLASLFAGFGAEVLATDLEGGDSQAWAQAGQNVGSIEALHWPNLVAWSEFARRARFQPVDMRGMDELAGQSFDFAWSSCSLEHLGSLAAGMEFVLRATDLLRPGGVGVHTTEFNVSSENATLETGDNVIYRRSDIQQLAERLRRRGARLFRPRFDPGRDAADLAADQPPYYLDGRQHVKLELGGFVSTSILLVVLKGR